MPRPIPTAALTLSATFGLAFADPLGAADWPGWRGPDHNGSSDASDLPVEFSADDKVCWSAPMPGSAASTPVVVGGTVFVSSTDEANETLLAIAYDLKSGAERWRKIVGRGLAQDNRSNFAGPSPVATSDRVAFFYGTGDLAVFDHSGSLQWKRNLQDDHGKFYFLWTFSSSPVIHGEKLIFQVLQRDTAVHDFQRGDGKQSSYLLAVDLNSGEQIYKVERPDDAVAEAKEAFSTPVLHTFGGKTRMLISGGDCLTGHDPETGEELWRWGTWNPDKIGHWRLVPSPVAGGGVALACAPKKAPVYAVKLGGSGRLADSDLAWISEDEAVSSDVSTPLFYGGHFYILHSDRKSISKVEPSSGDVVWTGDLDCQGKVEASPTAADGKIFCISHHGETRVVGTGDAFEILARAEMGPGRNGRVRSSITPTDGAILIRTDERLFCIGSPR